MKQKSFVSKLLVVLCSSLVLSGCRFELRKGNLDSLSSYVEKDEEDVVLLKPDILKLGEPNEPLTPVTRIQGHNLSLKNSVELVYYVNRRNTQETCFQGVLVWKDYREDETYTYANAEYRLTSSGKETFGNEEYDIYYFNGLAAKELSKYVYAVSYVFDGESYYYSQVDRYSVLDYYRNMELNEQLNTTMVEGGATLGNILEQIIAYGTTAQEYFGYNLNRLLNDTYYNLSLDYQDDYCGSLGGGYREGYFTSKEDIKVYARDLPDHCHLVYAELFGENSYYKQISSDDIINGNCAVFKIDRDLSCKVTYTDNMYPLFAHLVDGSGNQIGDDLECGYYKNGEVLNLKNILDKVVGHFLVSCKDWNGHEIESLTEFTFNYTNGANHTITATYNVTFYHFHFVTNGEDISLSFTDITFTFEELAEIKYFASILPQIYGSGDSGYSKISGWKIGSVSGTDAFNEGFEPTEAFKKAVAVSGYLTVEITLVGIVTSGQ